MMFITAFGVLFLRREMTEILSDAALSCARYINLVVIFYKKLAVLASKIACCELSILFSRSGKEAMSKNIFVHHHLSTVCYGAFTNHSPTDWVIEIFDGHASQGNGQLQLPPIF